MEVSTSSSQTVQQRIDAYLDQTETYDLYREILSPFKLTVGDEFVIDLYVRRLVEGEVTPVDFLDALSKEYGISRQTAGQIAASVAQRVLAPIENDLPFALSELRGEDQKLQEELEDIKQKKAAILQTKDVFDISGIVKEICTNPAFQFEDQPLRERCEKLVESRVRDVRTPEQTRAQLEKPVENGGLGVSGRRLSDMLAMIEGRVAAHQGNVSQEEQRKRVGKRATLPDKLELEKKEETLLTKRYVELTGKVPAEHISPVSPSVSRTSVAISAHHDQLAREGKIDASKVKSAVLSARESTVPARPKTVASMQEVTFEKRLSGPIDELRSLTLTDFRRLSKDALQAATKVQDKADLMEEQGYDKKVSAIQAWRSSPLNQLYVSITRDAVLTGTSVAEILEKKRKVGEETLTDEELKAVMKLNVELRF
ncbi:hypothetical protein EPN81_01320 [Patescibacteria group bacterium]|nr:MAG: hypothetical protein EPN81_01320 [Patescibacteria group bacterium]